MHGDEEFGMDEQGEMLRGQVSDPRWGQAPEGGSQRSLPIL